MSTSSDVVETSDGTYFEDWIKSWKGMFLFTYLCIYFYYDSLIGLGVSVST